MTGKESEEKGKSRREHLLLAEDIEGSVESLESRGDASIIDTYPTLNLVAVETGAGEVEKLRGEGYCPVEREVMEKIEPTLLERLSAKAESQVERLSALIDLDPYEDSNLREIEGQEGVEIEKSYPFLSSLHVSFPADLLLEIARLDFVKKLSDSRGEVRPTGGGEDGQD